MNLLIHVEQYDVVGILPSQLESMAFLASSLGIERYGFVDGTVDGVKRAFGFERYESLESWLEQVDGPIIAFTSDTGESVDVRELKPPGDAWLVFGPGMGWTKESFGDREITWSTIPIPLVLNSRDAVPIVLWELGR